MKMVIIGFSKPKKFKLHAALIMLLDKANFDHAYLRFRSENLERDIIYQAIGKGVEFRGKTLFEHTTDIVEEYKLNVEDEKYKKLMQFCIDNAGIPYGFLQILGACIVKFFAKIGKQIKNPFDNGLNSEFCSEIAARCLNLIEGEEIIKDVESISPKDLQTLLKERGAERIT